jgi:hypothetical protein
MKLLICTSCNDIFSLSKEKKICSCGETSGKYLEDGLHAVYSGKYAIPLGIDNLDLIWALANRPKSGDGKRFSSFVIPEICNTFVKKEF